MDVVVKEPVYIIIPVHNRKQITLQCLENLDKCGDLQRYHMVVVDDGSTDGTTEAIHSFYPDVVVLPGDGNLWWTGAIKKGMEYAYQQGAEYFIWLNDDCLVSDRAIQDLVSFSRQSDRSIVGCQGYELNNPEIIAFGGKVKNWKGYQIVNFPKDRVSKCDLLSGNLVCIPKPVVDKIGYPDPNILPHYGGDSLFLIRARKAGFKIFVDSRNSVFNIFCQSNLAPKQWLFQEGEPLAIIKLIFIPQSLYHRNVWLILELNDNLLIGIFLFLYKYTFYILLPICLISFLRFLPISIRKKLSSIKRLTLEKTEA
jgi:GT2 family glycosyltransferase